MWKSGVLRRGRLLVDALGADVLPAESTVQIEIGPFGAFLIRFLSNKLQETMLMVVRSIVDRAHIVGGYS
jgi:hypothetical protein